VFQLSPAANPRPPGASDAGKDTDVNYVLAIIDSRGGTRTHYLKKLSVLENIGPLSDPGIISQGSFFDNWER